MEKEIKQHLAKLKRISLSSQEKVLMRATLVRFMERHPLKAASASRVSRQSYPNRFAHMPWKITKPVALGLIIALLFGSTVSYAAERALPGDLLYPVKVNINEKVQSIVALSPESKARLEVKLTERRLEEVEELALNNRLNAETQATAQSGFEDHAIKAQEMIQKISENNDDVQIAADIHSDLESTLDAHGEIFKKIKQGNKNNATKKENNDEGNKALDDFAGKVQAHNDAASITRVQFEAKISAESGSGLKESAQGKLSAVENKLSEVEGFLQANKDTLDPDTQTRMEENLKDAQNLVISGNAKMDSQNYGEALVLFQSALRTAQGAKLSGEIEEKLNFHKKTEEVRSKRDKNANVNGSENSNGDTTRNTTKFLDGIKKNNEEELHRTENNIATSTSGNETENNDTVQKKENHQIDIGGGGIVPESSSSGGE